MHVVGGIPGFELIEHPQSMLLEGHGARDTRVMRATDTREKCGSILGNPRGKRGRKPGCHPRRRGMFEEDSARCVDTDVSRHTRDHSRCGQGIATELEEVVVAKGCV